MKRCVCLLLIICLLFACIPACAEDSWPLNCSIAISSGDLTLQVSGLYLDNAFYITPTDLCTLLPSMQMELKPGSTVVFTTNDGRRRFHIAQYLATNPRFELQEYLGEKVVYTGVPYLHHHNSNYISLLHFCRYIGIDFTVDPDSTESQIRLSPAYTTYDALSDLYFSDFDTPFSWKMINYSRDEMLGRLGFSSIITMLKNHPVWSLSGLWQENGTKLYAKDVLIRILKVRSLSQDAEDASTTQEVDKNTTIVKTVSELILKVLPLSSGQQDELIQLFSKLKAGTTYGPGIIESLKALSTYLSLEQADLELFQLTLCGIYAPYSRTLQGNDQFLDITRELQQNLTDTWAGISATISEEIVPMLFELLIDLTSSKTAGIAKKIAGAVSNTSLASDVLELTVPFLNESENLFSFAIANEIARAAQEIRLIPESFLTDSVLYDAPADAQEHTIAAMKAAMILQLRAEIVSYQMLRDSKALPDQYNHWINSQLYVLDQLLSRITNAVLRWPGYQNITYTEDLSGLRQYTEDASPSYSFNASVSFYTLSRGEVFDELFDIDGDGSEEYLFFDFWADKEYNYLQFLPASIDRYNAQSLASRYMKDYFHCFPDKYLYMSNGYTLRSEYAGTDAAQANEYAGLVLHTGADGLLYMGISKNYWGAAGWPDMYIQFYQQQDDSTELVYADVDLSEMLVSSNAINGYFIEHGIKGLDCEYIEDLNRWCLTIQQRGVHEDNSSITVKTCFTLDAGVPILQARYANGTRID
ncbi:MAG: hypothetical protein IJZ74_12565 [Clostridia bacterium]|nr:hypothetical protein [Clostridia bacterium]